MTVKSWPGYTVPHSCHENLFKNTIANPRLTESESLRVTSPTRGDPKTTAEGGSPRKTGDWSRAPGGPEGPNCVCACAPPHTHTHSPPPQPHKPSSLRHTPLHQTPGLISCGLNSSPQGQRISWVTGRRAGRRNTRRDQLTQQPAQRKQS